MKLNKLCSNLDQSNQATGGFTDAEKVTMRNNIGAADATSFNSLSNVVQDLKYNIDSINGILEATSSDAGKALIVNSSGNPAWTSIDSAPNISRISEFNTNSTYTLFGTNYGNENKRSM